MSNPNQPAGGEPPSYHDLHITTRDIPRTSIFNLPYGLEVTCNRVSGWRLWDSGSNWSGVVRDGQPVPSGLPLGVVGRPAEPRLLAGEYEGRKRWLVLDIDGHVIVDSRVGERAGDRV